MAKVTDRELRAKLNKPQEKTSEAIHNGVTIRITKTGKISFSFRYSLNGSRSKLSLGTYPAMSLAEAVSAKIEAQRLIDAGKDPRVEKKKTTLTYSVGEHFGALFDYWFENVHRSGKHNDGRRYRAVQNHIFPMFKDYPVRHITYPMMTKFLREKAKVIPSQTKDLITTLKQFWRWLSEEEHIDGLPIFEAIEAARLGAKTGRRSRVLTPEEIRLFWAATTRPRLGIRNRCIGQMCLLTGCRGIEFQRTEKSFYDSRHGVWTVTEHKTANKTGRPIVRALAPQAKNVIETALKTIKPNEISLWPKLENSKTGTGYTSMAYLCGTHLDYIKRKLGVEIPSFSLHDLRRTCKSYLEGLSGFGVIHPRMPQLALGHTFGGVEEVYNRWDYGDFIREGYEVYEQLLMHILATKETDMKTVVKDFVVEYRKKKDGASAKVIDIYTGTRIA